MKEQELENQKKEKEKEEEEEEEEEEVASDREWVYARRTGEENVGGETTREASTKRRRTFQLRLSLSLSLFPSFSENSRY